MEITLRDTMLPGGENKFSFFDTDVFMASSLNDIQFNFELSIRSDGPWPHYLFWKDIFSSYIKTESTEIVVFTLTYKHLSLVV